LDTTLGDAMLAAASTSLRLNVCQADMRTARVRAGRAAVDSQVITYQQTQAEEENNMVGPKKENKTHKSLH